MQPKYRAWHKLHCQMYPVRTLYLDAKEKQVELEGISVIFAFTIGKDVELMQFTGLKDKNDKEIYEGDLVRVEFPNKEPDFGWVIWDNTEGSWRIQSYAWWCYLSQGKLEIIGNVYTHPSILERSV